MIFKRTKIKVGSINKSIFGLYKPILIILLIFGYNFDIYDKKIITKIAAKLYCISLVTIVVFSTTICCVSSVTQIWSLLEYVSSVIFILFFRSKMRLFIEKLCEVDVYLRIRRKHYFWDRNKICLLTVLVWTTRLYNNYLYCSYYVCYEDFTLYLVSLISPIALDLNRVWRCIIFDTVRYRLKVLRVRLEENPEENFYLYIKNNKSIKEDKYKFCLKLYRNIADLLEFVSAELHASLFMSVACNSPRLIMNVYRILTVLEGHEPHESLNFSIIRLIQISVLLFSPFLVVEFYAVEVERIRLFLMHKLMEDIDLQSKNDIKLFMEYTKLRPFKYRIWRIIPINVAVPLELINLCTTYVIVIINFTHLYD